MQSKLDGTLAESTPDEDENAPPQVRIVGNVAVVPINGTILPHASLLERSCGAVGCTDIRAMLDDVRSKPGVKSVILDFDSPGGSVQGVAELAGVIAEFPIRTIAFTGAQCASASYWLGCGCDEILATPTSQIGSIGVFNAMLDKSAAFTGVGLENGRYSRAAR